MYYPLTGVVGSAIVWNRARQTAISPQTSLTRARRLVAAEGRDAILVLSEDKSLPGPDLRLLARFDECLCPDEVYEIWRLSAGVSASR